MTLVCDSLPVHGDAMFKDEVAPVVVDLGRATRPQQPNGSEPQVQLPAKIARARKKEFIDVMPIYFR